MNLFYLCFCCLPGESVPVDEQASKAADNRKSDLFDIQQLNIPEGGGVGPAMTNAEKKKFEKDMSKLYLQLDERVGFVLSCVKYHLEEHMDSSSLQTLHS